MPKNDKIYCIKNLSKMQLMILKKSLEMYTRLGLMQFDHLVDNMFNWGKSKYFSNAYSENRSEIEYHCREIRNLLTSDDEDMKKYNPKGNWSLGITNDKTVIDSKIAYEMGKDIEEKLDNNHIGKLNLSDETDIIVKMENPREEKLNQIIEKLKDKKNE